MQRNFAHCWLLGIKSELSTSAASLAETIRNGSSKEAQKAQHVLSERGKAALAYVSEHLALSAHAKAKREQEWGGELKTAAADAVAVPPVAVHLMSEEIQADTMMGYGAGFDD